MNTINLTDSIDVLGLSPRVRNALDRERIRTLEQLTGSYEWQITDIRGIGRDSIREINTALARHNLALKQPEGSDGDG